MEDLLLQFGDILEEVETGVTANSPGTIEPRVKFNRVECRLDTILQRNTRYVPDSVNTPTRVAGIVYISGNYGVGINRRFDEQNILRIDGILYSIMFVNEAFDGDGLHHYEVEVERGVNR